MPPVLWEHLVAGSNPVAPTQSKPSHTSELPRLAFLLDKSVHKLNGQILDNLFPDNESARYN